MSHGGTKKAVASDAPKLSPEGSSPLESTDLRGNRRTVDVPNQEVFVLLLEQLEELNATMGRIEEYFVQLTSNDLRQSISKARFSLNTLETEHGRN